MEEKIREMLRLLFSADKKFYTIGGLSYEKEYVLKQLRKLEDEDIKQIARDIRGRPMQDPDKYICAVLLKTAERKVEKKEVSYDDTKFRDRARHVPTYVPKGGAKQDAVGIMMIAGSKGWESYTTQERETDEEVERNIIINKELNRRVAEVVNDRQNRAT